MQGAENLLIPAEEGDSTSHRAVFRWQRWCPRRASILEFDIRVRERDQLLAVGTQYEKSLLPFGCNDLGWDRNRYDAELSVTADHDCRALRSWWRDGRDRAHDG